MPYKILVDTNGYRNFVTEKQCNSKKVRTFKYFTTKDICSLPTYRVGKTLTALNFALKLGKNL